MFFKIPTRGRVRQPSKSEASVRNKRLEALSVSKEIAQEIYKTSPALDFWLAGNTGAVLELCEEYNKGHEYVGFISNSMIFTELNHIFKAHKTT